MLYDPDAADVFGMHNPLRRLDVGVIPISGPHGLASSIRLLLLHRTESTRLPALPDLDDVVESVESAGS